MHTVHTRKVSAKHVKIRTTTCCSKSKQMNSAENATMFVTSRSAGDQSACVRFLGIKKETNKKELEEIYMNMPCASIKHVISKRVLPTAQ